MCTYVRGVFAGGVYAVLPCCVESAPPRGRSAPQMMVLNIPSYSRGADPWGWSRAPGVALDSPEEQANLLAAEQDFGDGRVEVVAYAER